MLAPDGTVGYIPSDRVNDALKAGGKLGVEMLAPDGTRGIVDRSMVVQAINAGGKVLHDSAQYIAPNNGRPAEQQPYSLNTDPVLNDLKDMAVGTAKNIAGITAPGIAYRLAKAKQQGTMQQEGESINRDVALNAGPMMIGAEELPRNSVAPKPSAKPMLDISADSEVGQASRKLALELAKEIPGVGTAMKFGDLWRAVGRVLTGDKGEMPPVAKPPAAPAPAPVADVPQRFNVPRDMPPAADVIAANPGELQRLQARGTRPTSPNVLPTQNRGLALPSGEQPAPAPAPEIKPQEATGPTEVPGSSVPRTLNGESVLNQALTGLDNKTLLKVARSRGIDVAKEAQLKPGKADQMLIRKIIDDFTPDELDNVRATGLEATRFRGAHDFATPAAAKEAWHIKVLQTYFPDVNIPQAAMNRVSSARVAPVAAPAPVVAKPSIAVEEMPLHELLQKSLDAIKASKGVQ